MKEAISIPLILSALLVSLCLGLCQGHERLDLNLMSREELMSLPGIGPSRADDILFERNRRGGFRSVEDLLKIRGIGRKLLARLRPYITVGSVKPVPGCDSVPLKQRAQENLKEVHHDQQCHHDR